MNLLQEPSVSAVYSLTMQVRDYECDLGGVVNNAVYFNYCEHARHEFFKFNGVDFAEYARRQINFVVVRSELDYKASLVSGDVFEVFVTSERVSRLRFAFHQTIRLANSGKLICEAKIFGAVLDSNGKPCMPAEIDALFGAMPAKDIAS